MRQGCGAARLEASTSFQGLAVRQAMPTSVRGLGARGERVERTAPIAGMRRKPAVTSQLDATAPPKTNVPLAAPAAWDQEGVHTGASSPKGSA